MAEAFLRVHFHSADGTLSELEAARPASFRGALPPAVDPAFGTDEAAARHYCERVFALDRRPRVRSLTARQRPELVPDLQLREVQPQKQTKTRLVRFGQVQSSVPIFGSNVVVELDDKRQLVSLDAEVANIKGVSPEPSLSAEAAIQSIAKQTGVAASDLKVAAAPTLTFFHDEQGGTWHLAWHLRKVPAEPMATSSGRATQATTAPAGHGLGRSPRDTRPSFDYLVDAHDGRVVFHYSAVPRLSPTKCWGEDESGSRREFYGTALATGGGFEMNDPWRMIETYDLGFKDLEKTPFPKQPIRSKKADWGATHRGAVSAHVNATRVYRFYRDVLVRDGIDNKGMKLVSVVNCIYEGDPHDREWRNAVWFDNRMWYGQTKDDAGALRSFSRHLDIIAHELTHGVTEHTANLVYRDEHGALNESISDIFGVLIANWDDTRPEADVSEWVWEIGRGLGRDGGPLRDLSDPKRTRAPAHMKDFVHTTADEGGVHANSSIHSKAAYNVLTARQRGQYLFRPADVAVLYYLALQRLGRLATFAKARQALLDAARTFYAGDAGRKAKIAGIEQAYAQVGIA